MQEKTQRPITRRNFLASTAAAGTFAALAGSMAGCSTWLAPTTQTQAEEHTAYLCHQFHCLSECCLKCTVRDGRLCLIEPNDAIAPEDRRICLRGINEIQHVYADDRLQTPLKRVGERGEGKFEAISWDEAIQTIGDELKKVQEKYGEDSIFFRKSTEAGEGQGFEYIPYVIHAHYGGKWGLDRGTANGWDLGGGRYSWLPQNSNKEWKLSRTLIFWGNNLLESGLTWSQHLFDAKEAGVKVISIDPRFSPTCAKADTWVPLKPGTDPALALAMVNTIVAEGWIDEEYMKAYTGFPFLVDEKTGKIATQTREVLDPETGQPMLDPESGEPLKDPKTGQPIVDEETGLPVMDPATQTVLTEEVPVVWDEAQRKVVMHDEEGADPAISGSHKVDGMSCVTEYDLMVKQLATYTPEWAADITGISADLIYSVTQQYATAGPAFIAFGLGGPDKYTNADVLGHALLLMTALTGNQGKPGCGTAYYGSGGATASAPFSYWALPEEDGYYYGGGEPSMYDFPFVENNVHAALTFGDVFTLESGSANEMLEWVKGLDFFAQVDIYHSSSVDYADIVLPACTKFENEEEITHLRNCKGYVALGNKAIDPLFESKTDLQIERLLAAQWGMEDALPQGYEELARFELDNDDMRAMGITFEALQNNQGVIRVGDEPQAQLAWGTPSGKLEPYAESMLDWGQAFPQWETPDESYEDNPKHAQYPFQFMQGKTRFRIHAYYSASAWFREFFGVLVNLSPQDAAERGIAQGDMLEVFNDRGSFKAKANINPGIRPGTLFMAESTYTKYFEEGLMQEVTNNARKDRAYDLNFGPQIPYNDTLVDIRKA